MCAMKVIHVCLENLYLVHHGIDFKFNMATCEQNMDLLYTLQPNTTL